MVARCGYCARLFENKRNSAKFCSDRCRAADKRRRDKYPKGVVFEPPDVLLRKNNKLRWQAISTISPDVGNVLGDIQGEFGVIAAEKALEACWMVFIAKGEAVPEPPPKPLKAKDIRARLLVLYGRIKQGNDGVRSQLDAEVQAIRAAAAGGDHLAAEVLGFALELLGKADTL